MPKIHTLSSDIYTVLDSALDHEPNPDLAAHYAMRIGGEFAKASIQRDKPREKGTLWASDLGKKCLRQHWYKFNAPKTEEPLPGHTKFKFLYGSILEEAVLYLAEEAGHKVAYPQESVTATINGWEVRGKIDCTIDDVLVDVKSTSSYGFNRYKYGINASNDSFGYLQQLGFYQGYGTFERSSTEQGFVWIDKQNGHIAYTPAVVDTKATLEATATSIIKAVGETEQTVPRGYDPVPYGKSGNMCLPIGCQYCSFKKHCHRDANGGLGIRTFAYNHMPVDFVEIKREPKVEEITR